MRNRLYTKALEYGRLAVGTPASSTQDAIYIGSGSFYENVTAAELYAPVLWINGENTLVSLGKVSQMTDLSGNDYHATNSDADSRPTRATSGLNTQKTIEFADASGGQHLIVADNNDLDFSGDFEMMIVIRIDEDASYDTFLAKDTINSAWSWVHANAGGGGMVKFFTSGTDPVGATELTLEKWYILGVSRTSGVIQLYLDGETDGDPSGSNTTDLSGTEDLYIGARWSGSATQQMLEGGIAELLVWDDSLSTNERANVVKYLQDRYFTSPIPADFSLVAGGVTTNYRRQPCGQILELAWDTVVSADNAASDIIGLKK